MRHKIELPDNYEIPQEQPADLSGDLISIYRKLDNYIKKYGQENNLEIHNPFVIGHFDIDDMQCLHFQAPFWSTYFSERGKRLDPCFFVNINDCLSFFISKVYRLNREVISYERWP